MPRRVLERGDDVTRGTVNPEGFAEHRRAWRPGAGAARPRARADRAAQRELARHADALDSLQQQSLASAAERRRRQAALRDASDAAGLAAEEARRAVVAALEEVHAEQREALAAGCKEAFAALPLMARSNALLVHRWETEQLRQANRRADAADHARESEPREREERRAAARVVARQAESRLARQARRHAREAAALAVPAAALEEGLLVLRRAREGAATCRQAAVARAEETAAAAAVQQAGRVLDRVLSSSEAAHATQMAALENELTPDGRSRYAPVRAAEGGMHVDGSFPGAVGGRKAMVPLDWRDDPGRYLATLYQSPFALDGVDPIDYLQLRPAKVRGRSNHGGEEADRALINDADLLRRLADAALEDDGGGEDAPLALVETFDSEDDGDAHVASPVAFAAAIALGKLERNPARPSEMPTGGGTTTDFKLRAPQIKLAGATVSVAAKHQGRPGCTLTPPGSPNLRRARADGRRTR